MKILIIFCTIFLLLLSGCGKSNTSDLVSIYHDYLDYSLGNWEIISKEKKESTSLMLEETKYFVWTIEYTSSDNVKRKIQFSNRAGNGLINRSISLDVLHHAEIVVQLQIEDLILKKYFKEDEMHASLGAKTSVLFNLSDPTLNDPAQIDIKVPYFDKLVSPSEGLKLYDVNAKTLLEKDPNYDFSILISSDLTDQKDMQNLRNIRDSVSNDLMEYLGDTDYRVIYTRIDWQKLLGTDKHEEAKYFYHGKEIPNIIK